MLKELSRAGVNPFRRGSTDPRTGGLGGVTGPRIGGPGVHKSRDRPALSQKTLAISMAQNVSMQV